MRNDFPEDRVSELAWAGTEGYARRGARHFKDHGAATASPLLVFPHVRGAEGGGRPHFFRQGLPTMS